MLMLGNKPVQYSYEKLLSFNNINHINKINGMVDNNDNDIDNNIDNNIDINNRNSIPSNYFSNYLNTNLPKQLSIILSNSIYDNVSVIMANSSQNIASNISTNICDESHDICDNLFVESPKVETCPHCESLDFIKYGRYKNIPRFKCKCCCRTFSTRTNSLWYYSKKSPDLWKEFCILQTEYASLAFCAKTLKINIATAFYWRHKLLNVLKNLTEPQTLQDHVSMIHCFIKESFKGSKNGAIQPHNNLWTVFTYDSQDNSHNIPFSRYGWRNSNFQKLVSSKIAPKTYITAGNGNNFIKAFARNHNKKLKKPLDELLITKVKAIIYTYKMIIRRTRGIATKYLLQYLALAKAQCLNKVFNFNDLIYNPNFEKMYIKSHKIKNFTSIYF